MQHETTSRSIDVASGLFRHATICHQGGDLDTAEAVYEQALKLVPGNAEIEHRLGILFYQRGDYSKATLRIARAISKSPPNAVYLSNLGNALQESGSLDQAIGSYLKALSIRPEFPEANFNLGNVLQKKSRHEDAIQAYTRALDYKNDFVDAYVHRGVSFLSLERLEESLVDFDNALRIQPNHVIAKINRGNTLYEMRRLAEALECFEEAIEIDPTNAEAHFNHGNTLYTLGRPAEAIASFDVAISLSPVYAKALSGKSLALLKLGRFEEGWPLYEWRWKAHGETKVQQHAKATLWLGDQDIRGRVILLHAEQGLGDTIQFCRYVPMVQALGARVILQVPEKLIPLTRGLEGYDELIGDKEVPDRIDFHCPLMSLPLAFKTTLETIPQVVPYLKADPALVEKWRAYIGEHGYKIAICWQGNPKNKLDKGRSFPLDLFKVIADIPGVRLISLQKNEGAEQALSPSTRSWLETLPKELDEGGAFVDSAAVMQCVDLVITSDTALTHLAGALNRPTQLVLSPAADWRWMANRSDTPWYPNHKIDWQRELGGWSEVFNKLKTVLVAEFYPS